MIGKNARINELEKQVLVFKNKFVLLEANGKRGAADRVTKSGRSTERGKIGLKDRGLYILVMLFPLPLWKKITQKLGNFSEDFIWVICGGFYLGNFVEDFI